MPSSILAASAFQAHPVSFPIYRGCDELTVIWTRDASAARALANEEEAPGFIVFTDRAAVLRFAEQLGAEIEKGSAAFYEDAEFLASIGMALPAGPSYDPADFPLPCADGVHPAVAAARAARSLGKDYREALWTAVLSGPNTITIHPPMALAFGQVDEAKERLRADFPGARVMSTPVAGVTMFVVVFPAEQVAA